VTDSSIPPDGSDRAASRLRPTPHHASGQPDPALRERPKPRAVSSPQAPSAASPASVASAAPREGAANGQAAPRAPAQAQSVPVRSVAPVPKVVPGGGEPYPPLSERVVNGVATAPAPPQRPEPKRAAPRSARDALEPDRIEIPSERRRSKRARHPLVVVGNAIITLFLIVSVAAGYLLYIGKQRFDAPGPLQADKVVNIPHGSGIRDIADLLTKDGVIDQPWVFIGGVLVLKAHEGLKAGEYEFKAHSSLSDVVTTLSDGKVVMHQVSIPEGLTSEQIVARLMDNDVLTGNIDEVPAEGSMLPDTYNFTRGMTRSQLIQHMQQAQQRLLKEIWARRAADLPIKTPEQLVILASLIEKETGKPDERTRIAAVFVNRLKQKMRLQSDPTIIYGLVGGKGTLGRAIMKSEIDQPTLYNTYQIDGLPPGPITNPGRASLEAAANPARTRDLYFVADGTGGHVFAETYEQHQKNVAHLRQVENGQKDPSIYKPAAETPVPAEDPAPPPAPQPAVRHPKRKRRVKPSQ
jgi:peptidoglycan lytic transglycosylase G